MGKLKLLQLEYVKLTGSYKNFPGLTWLCWHGSQFETIPSGLLTGSLVAIDMSYGIFLRKFEVPAVLHSLKSINFKSCWDLVSIRNLDRTPNLETLILWDCLRLTHICKTIAGLERLALLDLSGCDLLLKVSSKKKLIKQQSFTLPHSLQFLFLNDFDLKKLNDFQVVFSGQPFFYLNLGNNLFEVLPNNIDFKMLRVLDLTSCRCLKSLLCLPSTLEELYIYSCESLEKVTFQSARFRLRRFGYSGCSKLCEIQGLFKLVSIKNIDVAELGHMRWIKAFQDHTVEMMGDQITEGRPQHIQILYEYGIRSTYLWRKDGINQIIMSVYTSEFPFLSFQVPFCPNQRKIKGLNVNVDYLSLGNIDQDDCVLFAKVHIKNKGLTWIYNPVVYCKPRFDIFAEWLSYWPIGNILEPGDKVEVSIVDRGLIVSRCGASLVYVRSEFTEEKESENNAKAEEVIGGDLSEFELTKGVYYLCRRDLFKSVSRHWLKMLLVGDTVHYTELQGWKHCRQSGQMDASFRYLKTFRYCDNKNFLGRVIVRSKKRERKVLKAVYSVPGVEKAAFDVQTGMLHVTGKIEFRRMALRIFKTRSFADFFSKNCFKAL